MGSFIGKRCLTRPLGYAGDYETMRMCYDNAYEGSTEVGKKIHKYVMESPSAQAVRNRCSLVSGMATGKSKILSVACGPAYEVPDILDKNPGASVTMLDQDEEALGAAARRIRSQDNVKYLRMPVSHLMKKDCNIGSFDFIYSMGLFDYLDDRIAKELCDVMFRMLNPGGVLLIGNYHVTCVNRYEMQYWCDWSLVYRTEKSMYDLVPSGANATVTYEGTGSQMFLVIKRIIEDQESKM